ncbi:uncharacterized protein BP01DRAFT_101530 [Aspergillus saccharolyticus JOP 1030-1]|uniref:Uncharacterized protein n=1 Tax=Aspergillus saccharolyticus JOP 1030-1 TaxID=1450539 RepID=A0A318ZB71_9EURO|nr:hypothetical protein BP01DRAFT_101530 [Aspergillus saccharolyticus JOP 1030-1]PYH43584.1 hypothetical protein BP01DRAFT_101530 [Aspergillus saccharolyticus JOP 1030-1]
MMNLHSKRPRINGAPGQLCNYPMVQWGILRRMHFAHLLLIFPAACDLICSFNLAIEQMRINDENSIRPHYAQEYHSRSITLPRQEFQKTQGPANLSFKRATAIRAIARKRRSVIREDQGKIPLTLSTVYSIACFPRPLDIEGHHR